MNRLSGLGVAVVLLAVQAFGSDGSAALVKPAEVTPKPTHAWFGVGAKVSTLGIGGEFAVPITARTNARFGFNAFNYNHTFTDVSGVDYKGTLSLRSAQAQIDIFPWGGSFHISPGVMFYDGNRFGAVALLDPKTALKSSDPRGGAGTSSASDPLRAVAHLEMAKVNPMITVGRGNLLPRKVGKHLTFGFEVGVVYQGTPRSQLVVTGSACDQNGQHCQSVATVKEFRANVADEERQLRQRVSAFKVYPILSTELGFHF